MKKIISFIVVLSLVSCPILGKDKKCKKAYVSFIATPVFASGLALSIYMLKKLKNELVEKENALLPQAEEFVRTQGLDATYVRAHKDSIFNPNVIVAREGTLVRNNFGEQISELWSLDGKINLLYLAIITSSLGTAIAGYKSLQKIFSSEK